jgi:hypothetical protein
VTLTFLCVAGFAMASHELWRDEAEPWLVALHSGSLLELFRHVKYEGHPGLWFTCLFLLTRVTGSPVAMQLLHLAIGAAGVWIFARFAPFTPLQRVLFAFGYFPLYEYTVVSRDYGLGMVLLLATCAALGARPARFPLVVLLFVLIPHTNAFAAILGLALGITLLADRWLPGGPVLAEGVSRTQLAAGLLVALSAGLAIFQTAPPADLQIDLGWRPRFELSFLAKRLRSVTPALFPIPQVELHWWIRPFLWNLSELHPYRFPVTVAVYALLCWIGLGLVRLPRALIFLITAMGSTLAFIYLRFPGEIRHIGHFFVALVAALWLAKIEAVRRGGVGNGWIGRAWVSTQGILFTMLLAVQMVGGLLAVFLDHRYVFSNGKPAAAYLVQHGLDRAPLVAEPDYLAESVLVYLHRRDAYFPRGDRTGAFVIWDQVRVAPVADSTCVARARRLAAEQGGPAVLMMDHPLAVAAADSLGTRELARLVGSTVGDEDFYLYAVTAVAR